MRAWNRAQAERAVGHGKRVADGGHDRANHEPGGHGGKEGQGTRPEDGTLSGPKRHGWDGDL